MSERDGAVEALANAVACEWDRISKSGTTATEVAEALLRGPWGMERRGYRIEAAAPAPPALDVARLARAIAAWWAPVQEHVSGRITLDPADAAEAIAAEYARLAQQDAPR